MALEIGGRNKIYADALISSLNSVPLPLQMLKNGLERFHSSLPTIQYSDRMPQATHQVSLVSN